MRSDPPVSESPTRLEALSSLRFFAAFAVLTLHFSPFISLPPLLSALAHEGRAGVSFFFVLSGFILYYTYHARFAFRLSRNSLGQFFQARFARVYPLHMVTLLAITPVVFGQLQDARLAFERYGAHVLKPLHVGLSWVTNLALVNVYVPLVGGGIFTYAFLWNAPAWSIACEAVFYLVFPFFSVLVLRHFKTQRALWWLMVGLYGIELLLIASANWAIPQKVMVDYMTYHLPIFRIWEFLIGMACGKLFVSRRTVAPAAEGNWAGAMRSFAMIGLAVAIVDVALLPQWWPLSSLSPRVALLVKAGMDYAFYTPLFAGLIYVAAMGRSRTTSMLAWRPLVILGEASYSLYMIHWIPVTVLKHWKIQGFMLPHEAVWLIIAGVVAASVACYYGFENPVRQLLRPRGISNQQVKPATLGSAPSS